MLYESALGIKDTTIVTLPRKYNFDYLFTTGSCYITAKTTVTVNEKSVTDIVY